MPNSPYPGNPHSLHSMTRLSRILRIISCYVLIFSLSVTQLACKEKANLRNQEESLSVEKNLRLLAKAGKWVVVTAKIEKMTEKNYAHYFLLGFALEKQKKSKEALLAYLMASRFNNLKMPSRIANNEIIGYLKTGKPTPIFPYAAFKVARLMQLYGLYHGSELVIKLIEEKDNDYLAEQIRKLQAENYFRQGKLDLSLKYQNLLLKDGSYAPYFKMAVIYAKKNALKEAIGCYRKILYKSQIPWQKSLASAQLLNLAEKGKLDNGLSQKDLLYIAWSYGEVKKIKKAIGALKTIWPQYPAINPSVIPGAQMPVLLQAMMEIEGRQDKMEFPIAVYNQIFLKIPRPEEAYQTFFNQANHLYQNRNFSKAYQMLDFINKFINRQYKNKLIKSKETNLVSTMIKIQSYLGTIQIMNGNFDHAGELFSSLEGLSQKTAAKINADDLEPLAWELSSTELAKKNYRRAGDILRRFFQMTGSLGSPKMLYWNGMTAIRASAKKISFEEYLEKFQRLLFLETNNFYSAMALVFGMKNFSAEFDFSEKLMTAFPGKKLRTFLDNEFKTKEAGEQETKNMLLNLLTFQRALGRAHFTDEGYEIGSMTEGIQPRRRESPVRQNKILAMNDQQFAEHLRHLLKKTTVSEARQILSREKTAAQSIDNLFKNPISSLTSWTKNDIYIYDSAFFWNLGLIQMAQDVLEKYSKTQKIKYLSALILMSYKHADAHLGLKFTQEYIQEKNIQKNQLFLYPLVLKQNLFPRPFGPITEKVAGKYHLDPNLIWAIMKAESSFLEKAVSPAGAVGIMQLLPVTGHKIAKEMGFYPPDLTNPKVAIYAGGDLIATLSRKFGNNLVWVAAAYNAGILKAYEWKRKTHGLPLDLSVEQISFGETKRYVFRILNNYIVYSGIYEE